MSTISPVVEQNLRAPGDEARLWAFGGFAKEPTMPVDRPATFDVNPPAKIGAPVLHVSTARRGQRIAP